MSTDEKYFRGNSESLRQPPEIRLSEKLKIFFHLYTAFLKSTFNFKYFLKKDESSSLCLSKIIDRKTRASANV